MNKFSFLMVMEMTLGIIVEQIDETSAALRGFWH